MAVPYTKLGGGVEKTENNLKAANAFRAASFQTAYDYASVMSLDVLLH